ncbi:MAG: glycosyltransferase family 4 protein [Planctomycetes bacterium]|nr:glycosyltransferase family 4 protein [Planctomycetota bacterium]
MIRILHLIDSTADWQHRVALGQLLDRLGPERFECRLAATDVRAGAEVSPADREVRPFRRLLGIDALAAPALRSYLSGAGIDLIHAWGVSAAVTAAAAASATPLVVELFDPAVCVAEARRIRSVFKPGGLALICSSQTVRRRLIENGIAPEAAVVIRPGVDFALINAARKRDLRGKLGLNRDHRVVLVPAPVVRPGGHFTCYWAAVVRLLIEPGLRLILPGRSPEQARLVRLARGHGFEHLLTCPGDAVNYEELVAAADLMITAPQGDYPTTALAWAMAAGVPVLGTAVYGIAELIAHRHNGLLVKPEAPRPTALRLAALFDHDDLTGLADAARSQAYEVFGLRRCVDQHADLYENLLAGRTPGEGIDDSAVCG